MPFKLKAFRSSPPRKFRSFISFIEHTLFASSFDYLLFFVFFHSLSPVALRLEKKKQKMVVHREKVPKDSPAVAPSTPIPPKEEEYPLPSQRQSSQPDASKPDVWERADYAQAAGLSFVPDESVPSFDKKFKVKTEK